MKKALKKILRPPYAYLRYPALGCLTNRHSKPFEPYGKTVGLPSVSTKHRTGFLGYYNVSAGNDSPRVIHTEPIDNGNDGMSRLYLYNMSTDDIYCLGRFYRPLKYAGTDLHPKWDMSEDKIYLESGHGGYRKPYAMNPPMYPNEQQSIS